jgi:formiminotetrahydrofolate cyclodeaminase
MEPPPSVWKLTLAEFDGQIVQGTGAVAVAAISAAFAVSVLRMVLEITARKEESASHLGKIRKLLEAASLESERLKRTSEEDHAAYAAYRQAFRLPQTTESEREERSRALRSTLREATETPLNAARAAVSAIELCAEAAPLARGDVSADIGGAADILNGALRAILNSVDANLRRLNDEQLAVERRELAKRASRLGEEVRERLRKLGAELR